MAPLSHPQLAHAIVRRGVAYFLVVFGAGFALAFVRIPFLVPRFGVRVAELMEMPVMLLVIAWASRRVARHPGTPAARGARLAIGGVALSLLITAELAVAWWAGAQSPGEYVAGRDPVSFTAYLVSLGVFAVAPAAWPRASPGHDPFRS